MQLVKKNINKGFSLLEILLVLAIAAGIVSAAFIIYPKVQTSFKINREATNIATIQAGIKSIYGSVSNFSGLNTDFAINANIVPEDMIQENAGVKTIVNSFKGSVTISSSNYGPNSTVDASYNITYTGLQTEECIKLGVASVRNVYNMRINGIPLSAIVSDGVEINITSRCKTKTPATIEFIGL